MALLLAAAGAVGAMLPAQAGAAEDEELEELEEVVVTGTSIRRAQAEGALPVQVFRSEDIEQSGMTSVTDFIQQLPVMQGFTSAADSVGGGGGGITTASIHDVGEQYTLVLVNGRRVAPSDSGSTIDINTLPLSAVDRVEVLTDGASALYGADAIAGVVNFILKTGESPLELSARYSLPQEDGGRSMNASISKGFGDLQDSGFEAFLALGYDKSKRLASTQRDFASTGIITGRHGDLNYEFFNGSSRSIPPNVDVFFDGTLLDDDGDPIQSTSLSPYLQINGDCPPAHVVLGAQCFFDYVTTVEIAPEIERKTFYGSARWKLGDTWSASLELMSAGGNIVAAIAPYPAEFGIDQSSSFYSTYVEPYLTAEELAAVDPSIPANVKYRLYDLGSRRYDYETNTAHIVGGLSGRMGNWDVSGNLTLSKQDQEENYVAGFPLAEEFFAAMEAGQIDPFPYQLGEMPSDQLAALRATQYVGNYKRNKMEMRGLEFNAQRPIFDMSGGSFIVSFGGEYRDADYSETPSEVAAQGLILFDSPQPEIGLARDNWGGYMEFLAPLAQAVEVTGGVRYDSYSGVKDKIAGETIGGTESEVTYKIGAKWNVLPSLALRASYGTGFRVTDMRQIAQPRVDWGVTGGTYDCPFSASYDPLGFIAAGYICANDSQYEMWQGGNPELTPETSKQWNAGLVWSPTRDFSAGVNYWSVQIKDSVDAVAEDLILSNPENYLDLYTTKFKSSNGLTYVAIVEQPINIGRVENEGIDWDFSWKGDLAFGDLGVRVSGTHLVKSRYTLPGTDDVWTTSLGRYGVNELVSFDDVITASLSLRTGRLENSLLARYKSGYTDIPFTEDDCVFYTDALDCAAGALDVPSYTVFDWRTTWRPNENLDLTFGIENLLDKDPPLSLRFAGPHQLGYDPHYANPYLRTFVLDVAYRF